MSSIKNSNRKVTASSKQSTLKQSTAKKSTSPIHTRVNNGASSQHGHKYTETELNNYLNRVVDKHFDEA